MLCVLEKVLICFVLFSSCLIVCFVYLVYVLSVLLVFFFLNMIVFELGFFVILYNMFISLLEMLNIFCK